MSGVFHTRDPGWQALAAAAKPFRDRYGSAFGSGPEANQFFRKMVVPACGTWVFCPNGKTGSSSTLHFLFHLMFGVPLTVRREDGLSSQSSGPHQLTLSRVFADLALMGPGHDPVTVFDTALRLTTVRDPFRRAVSGFLYLCLSDAQAATQFMDSRQRLSAMCRFDWRHHPGTLDGFLRYLDWLEQEFTHPGTRPVDSHFRPQVLNVRPEILQPDLVGRCEDLPTFFNEIARRLARPLPENLDLGARHNAQDAADRCVFETPRSRARVEQIFAADYEVFGY